MPDPSYPIHIYGAVIAGADIRSIPVAPDVDFLRAGKPSVAATPKPKMMVVFGFRPTPRPSAWSWTSRARVALARARHPGGNDLAYADIVFDLPPHQGPSTCRCRVPRTWRWSSFTPEQELAPAGWRWVCMAATPTWWRALARIKSYHDYGTLHLLQVAAIVALEGATRPSERHCCPVPEPPRPCFCQGPHGGWLGG